MHAILRGQILHANSGNFKMGFSYSVNAPVQRRAAQRTVHCNRLLGGEGRILDLTVGTTMRTIAPRRRYHIPL